MAEVKNERKKVYYSTFFMKNEKITFSFRKFPFESDKLVPFIEHDIFMPIEIY